MTGLEIGLLIIGAAFFIGSFFFTEKLSSSDIEAIEKMSENEINILLEKQMRQASDKIERTIDEKLITSLASAERQINKTANEQILSISDHGDEVREVINRDMEAVNKSHDEIVFMHTMLNEKQKKVTDIEKEAQQLESQMRALKQGIEDELFVRAKEKGVAIPDAAPVPLPPIIPEQKEEIPEASQKPEDKPIEEPPEHVIPPEVPPEEEEMQKENGASAADIVADAKSLKEAFAQKLSDGNGSASEDGLAEDGLENVNEKILSLHKEGFSEVEIAKRLGKGLGEIKLVLGLFDEDEE